MTMPPPKAKTVSAISKRLIEDHDTMRSHLAELKTALYEICHRQSQGHLQQAQHLAHQVVLEMNTHAAHEEHALFPVLAKHHPMPILEIEHEEAFFQRAALVSGILNYTFPEDCNETLYQQGVAFIDMMLRHMAKEERAIFPLAEEALSPSEKHQVIAQMEDIRARARVLPTEARPPEARQFISFHVPLNAPLSQDIQTEALVEQDNLQLKTISLRAGQALATHWSPKQLSLILLSGSAQWNGPEATVDMQPGDGLCMDPKLRYSLSAKTDCRFLMVGHSIPLN